MNERQRIGEEIIDLERQRAALENATADVTARLKEKRERLALLSREESRTRCAKAGEAA